MGGIETEEMVVMSHTARVGHSRAASLKLPAESVDWLVQPLTTGLDIIYGLSNGTAEQKDVAILKYLGKDDGEEFSRYSFKYRADRTAQVGTDNDAIWYDNGYHFFQGVNVPERIRYSPEKNETVENVSGETGTAAAITTEQWNGNDTGEDSALGNYTLLAHYLGMPANFRLLATVERIKLPFRHRLARVVAFVLIDPELHAHLKGYKKDKDGNDTADEDPQNTSFRFCNVKVLQGVEDKTGADDHHILTPKWSTGRKIIPHFEGEKGSYNYALSGDAAELDPNGFKFYYKEEDGKREELFPTTDGWATVHGATKDKDGLYNGYTEIDYGLVPVYDIIVRPTYTEVAQVMYDEEDYDDVAKRTALADETNSIHFELELDNGLEYEKTFEFDLDAGYQTVVYLRISREHVDYNSSDSELWIETKDTDDWYGVDNENGNTLSFAGSSWQRAYRSASATLPGDDRVTDGDLYYNGESVGQYLQSDALWTQLLLQACHGGEHHGDYFVLDNNITIDATAIPKDFVFTGHLDGQDHVITLTGSGLPVYKAAESLEGLFIESAGSYTPWTIPTLYVKHVTPATYYTADDLQDVGDGTTYVKSSVHWVEAVYYTQAECDTENSRPEHHPQTVDSQGRQPGEQDYVDTRDMTSYVDGYTPLTTSTVKTPAHWDTSSGIQKNVGELKTAEVITYPLATADTDPHYPTTLDDLKSKAYFINDSGTPFVCPAPLYQFSHTSPAYLFSGLDGTYTTWQEEHKANDECYASDNYKLWEANVHKESNKTTVWVPTAGYRAEVLNVRMAPSSALFKSDATITGNVQNCFNGSTHIADHTPAIPGYK